MKKLSKTFLRLLAFVVLLLSVVFPIAISNAEAQTTDTLVIHYFRYDGNYNNWALWLWDVDLNNGAEYQFNGSDAYGTTLTIDLADIAENSVSIGLIVKSKGSWDSKDIDSDRFISVPETCEDGILNIYLVEGDTRIGYSLDDPNGPDRSDKFQIAYFKTTTDIHFTATQTLLADNISVYKGDEEAAISEITITGLNGVITLSQDVDLTYSYVIKAIFSDDVERSYDITFDGIYDSLSFERTFGYEGDDLGAVVANNTTTFKVWAPIAKEVVLNLYNSGTPQRLGGTDTPTDTISMEKDVKGTWKAVVGSDLHNTYYTYTVTNGSNTYEVVDPYAKATGINGLRGLVVNFDKVNPTGWEYNKRANNITNETDAVIYELHVRDLTSHSSWGGSSDNAAKFLGLCEEGTTYNGVSTGFDHIKELGVTHVQLLPIFDYGVVDESRLTQASYLDGAGEGFNWGYMPINYNSLEGGYSSNPYDGLTSITEMKQVIMAYTQNNIRINMDVVYNHTGQNQDSNFNLLVPGYYHRTNSDGSWSNGSGCGNETASERIMMRKFIVESVEFWATEYNLGGFRFDLMALHDTTTMNTLANKLKEIDETIMIYGEPWNGGTTPLSSSIAADKVNLNQMTYVGAFNDDIRDGIKGSVFNATEKGWVQGNASSINKVKYGIVGGINYPGLDYGSISYQRAWNTSPLKTINYVACHDNNTLYDKLMQTLGVNQRNDIEYYQKQANAIVLLSQGIPFIHAGDEIMRSKPAIGGGYDHNSYESPDSVNQIRWDQKVDTARMNVYNYYKGLISLRKKHSAFRMTDATSIVNNLEFVDLGNNNLLAYRLKNNANGDSWEEILVVFNNSSQAQTFTTLSGDGDWSIVVNRLTAGTDEIDYIPANTLYYALPHESLVLVQGYVKEAEEAPSTSGCGCNSASVVAILSTCMAVATLGIVILKQKNS